MYKHFDLWLRISFIFKNMLEKPVYLFFIEKNYLTYNKAWVKYLINKN